MHILLIMSIIENQIAAISPEPYVQPQPFTNPICQSTYKALPKIYGQPSTTKMKFTSRQKFQQFVKPRFNTSENQQATSQSKFKNKQNIKKQSNITKTSLKYQSCSHMRMTHIQSSPQQGKTTRFSRGKIQKLKLPGLSDLKTFQPSQIQTSHKIVRTDSNQKASSMAFLTTGLGQLVSNNARVHTNFIEKKINFIQPQINKQQISEGDIKNLPINKSSLYKKNISLESDSQQKSSKLEKNSEKIVYRYQSESDQDSILQRKNRQSSFKKSKNFRQTTVFQENNKKMEHFKNRKRNNSTHSNGLFVIPEQNQYQNYIENYQPIDRQFNFKQLITSPDFQIIKSSKGVYFGQLKQGYKHGKGLYISDKQIYQGKYQNNFKVQGCQRNVDGVYIGQFLNGQRSGIGIFRWNNGQIFEGQWKKGVKNGHGIWTSPKGDYYDGQWYMNRQQGKGVFKHKNSTYKGSFVNFLKHGYGQQKFANGDSYFGQYKQGRPDGNGKYQWSTGGYYQGNFSKGFRQGLGKWIQSNGDIYTGHFHQDLKQGEGKQIYKSGQIFEGYFSQGKQISGILYSKNGSILRKIE